MKTRKAGAVRTLAIRRGIVVAALLLGPVTWAACFDFSTSPDELLYLAFDNLPYPSVVAGDSLRDSSGAAAALTARAVAADGDEIESAPIRFFSIGDTAGALEVDSTSGWVVSANVAPQSVRVIASVQGLQSQQLNLRVTTRPDSLAIGVEVDTISYSLLDSTLNFSRALAMNVLHHDSSTFYSGVANWVVRYSLERRSDTVYASLVDDQNRRLRSQPTGYMHIDTTASDGAAGRKLRIQPGPPLGTPLDSVAVLVEATYMGVHVAGSPARVIVYVRPRTAP
jgi:hypothetical protein